MSMPSGAPSAAFLSQTLGHPGLSAARSHEVADLVAGLSDLGQRVGDLSAMVGDAEQQLRRLAQKAGTPSTKRTAAGRALEEQGWADDLDQGKRQLRRLREALHDAQQDMDALSSQHGASSELDQLRAQCQQDDMRARALEAELTERLGQEAQRVESAQRARRREEQARLDGGASGTSSGSHLQAASGLDFGQGGQHSRGWEPPQELRSDFDDVALRAGKFLNREGQRSSGEGEPFEGAPTSQGQAEVQARLAKVLVHPAMPKFSDPADLVQWVIRQAHADGALDIQGYAHKLHFSTKLKETIREELSRARKFRSDHGARAKDGAMDAPFERVDVSRDPDIDSAGVPRVRPPAPAGEITRVEELDAHISDLQNMLASTGEDMQISQLELQNMTQRQQQVMNVMSNLSKALHETSMAIIRKIGN